MNTLRQLQNRLIDFSEYKSDRKIDTTLIEKSDLATALKLYKIFLGQDSLTAQAERELIREARETLKKLQPKSEQQH